MPHGLPNGIQKEFPLSVKDQQETEAWQLLSHQRLEEELQVEVDGYVNFKNKIFIAFFYFFFVLLIARYLSWEFLKFDSQNFDRH